MDDQRWLRNEIIKAYYDARKGGKRKTLDEQKFETEKYQEFRLLAEELENRTYKPRSGIAFIVNDPVQREIFAAPFRDRVVHHFLFNQSAEWWDRRLIFDSYSCRKGKGTLFAIQRMQKHMLSASLNGTRKAYVLKFDLKGYFMSLPQEGLYKDIVWGLDRQFTKPYEEWKKRLLKFGWRQVIFDKPTEHVKIRGRKRDWIGLPPNKSLFNQPDGVGIVIGNLTSQELSNIYLDKFDRYVKYELGFKHYGRYVDDFFIIVSEDDFERAKAAVPRMELFLNEMGLSLHEKKRYIQEVNHGCSFVGAVVYPRNIIMNKRTRKNYQRTMFEVVAGKKDITSAVSYMGTVSHFKHTEMERKIWNKAGLDYN